MKPLLLVAAMAAPLCAAVLPPCHGDPKIDDTPALYAVITKSDANLFTVFPGRDCYVNFSGAYTLPAGTTLAGKPSRSVLHAFNPAANLFAITRPDITLEGLTLDSPFPSLSGYHGVLLWITGQNSQLLHNRITSSAQGGTSGIAVWAWNTNVDIEGNEITDYTTQIYVTASPGREPHVRIIGNRLHDNNAAGGNAIVIASDSPSTKADIPTTIDGNYIWDISAAPNTNGQTGNGVDLDHANKVRISDNYAKTVKFSCWRAFSSDDLIAEGNQCTDAGETGAFSEYASLHNQWVNNFFERIKGPCLSLTNFDMGGQHHTAIGNHMIGCGGAGIQAEAGAILDGNMIDQATTGILLGYGAFGQHVIARGNYIMDTSGTGVTTRGIAIEAHTGGDMRIEGNEILLDAHQIEGTAWGVMAAAGVLPPTVTVRDQEIPFALLGNAANGSFVYCPDCTAGPVCTGAGSGAFAKRLAGAWVCN
jgi:Nitrous oxidase accessory protein